MSEKTDTSEVMSPAEQKLAKENRTLELLRQANPANPEEVAKLLEGYDQHQ